MRSPAEVEKQLASISMNGSDGDPKRGLVAPVATLEIFQCGPTVPIKVTAPGSSSLSLASPSTTVIVVVPSDKRSCGTANAEPVNANIAVTARICLFIV